MAEDPKRAGEKVEKAVHEEKEGKLKTGTGKKSHLGEAGSSDWPVRSQESGRKSAKEKITVLREEVQPGLKMRTPAIFITV